MASAADRCLKLLQELAVLDEAAKAPQKRRAAIRKELKELAAETEGGISDNGSSGNKSGEEDSESDSDSNDSGNGSKSGKDSDSDSDGNNDAPSSGDDVAKLLAEARAEAATACLLLPTGAQLSATLQRQATKTQAKELLEVMTRRRQKRPGAAQLSRAVDVQQARAAAEKTLTQRPNAVEVGPGHPECSR